MNHVLCDPPQYWCCCKSPRVDRVIRQCWVILQLFDLLFIVHYLPWVTQLFLFHYSRTYSIIIFFFSKKIKPYNLFYKRVFFVKLRLNRKICVLWVFQQSWKLNWDPKKIMAISLHYYIILSKYIYATWNCIFTIYFLFGMEDTTILYFLFLFDWLIGVYLHHFSACFN